MFVVGSYLQMGYGSLSFAALTAGGKLRSSVTANLEHLLSTLPKNNLNGGAAFPGPDDGLIIVGSASTKGNPNVDRASPGFAYVEQVRSDGQLAAPGARHFFSQPYPGVEWWGGTELPSGQVVAGTLDYRTHELLLRSFAPDGSVNAHFGPHGLEPIRLGAGSYFLPPVVTPGAPGDVDVVYGVAHGARLVELRG